MSRARDEIKTPKSNLRKSDLQALSFAHYGFFYTAIYIVPLGQTCIDVLTLIT